MTHHARRVSTAGLVIFRVDTRLREADQAMVTSLQGVLNVKAAQELQRQLLEITQSRPKGQPLFWIVDALQVVGFDTPVQEPLVSIYEFVNAELAQHLMLIIDDDPSKGMFRAFMVGAAMGRIYLHRVSSMHEANQRLDQLKREAAPAVSTAFK